jgi:hypothetical protein
MILRLILNTPATQTVSPARTAVLVLVLVAIVIEEIPHLWQLVDIANVGPIQSI